MIHAYILTKPDCQKCEYLKLKWADAVDDGRIRVVMQSDDPHDGMGFLEFLAYYNIGMDDLEMPITIVDNGIESYVQHGAVKGNQLLKMYIGDNKEMK